MQNKETAAPVDQTTCWHIDLRDWFAGQVAAQCIRNALNDDGGWDHHNVAYHAYLIADAMLTEREKPDV